MIIYLITNKINDKMYIGQTIRTLEDRWYEHCIGLEKSTIHNAIRKYGKEAFSVEVIDTASTIEELNEKEKYWIEKLNTLSPNGYNLASGGLNFKHSDETRIKLRRRIYSKEFRQKRSEIQRRLWQDPEYRLKFSQSRRGRHASEESREKNRLSHLGKVHTDETRQKMRVAHTGKRRHHK